MKPLLTPDDPRLTAYALGELSARETAAIEAALADAPECRRTVEEARESAKLLRAELAAEPCPESFVNTRVERATLPVSAGYQPAESGRQVAARDRLVACSTIAETTALLRRLVALWARPLAWATVLALVAAATVWLQTRRSGVTDIARLAPIAPASHAPEAVRPETRVPSADAQAVIHPTTSAPPLTVVVQRIEPPLPPGQTAPVAVTPSSEKTEAVDPAAALAGVGVPPRPSATLVPLPIVLPVPASKGTPMELPANTTALRPTGKPRPPFYAPAGVTNIAHGRPVTSSDRAPITGSIEQITDGVKEATDTSVVELHRRTQWVQIDLGAPHTIYAVLLWHAHHTPAIYRDVVVQLADEPDFLQYVRTIFNNDQDNSSGLGVGADREYFETNEGHLVDAKGQIARYVRLYSKGSTDSALNCYTEVEVYGWPAGTASSSATPAESAPLPLRLPAPTFR